MRGVSGRCAGGKGLDAIGRPVVNWKMRVITLEFYSIGPLVQVFVQVFHSFL